MVDGPWTTAKTYRLDQTKITKRDHEEKKGTGDLIAD